MKFKYLLFSGFLTLLAPNLASAKYRVYYIPFDVETFAPVDAEQIEQQAEFIIDYRDTVLDQAFAVERTAPAKEPSNVVNLRAKIVRTKDQRVVYLNKPLGLLTNQMVDLGNQKLAQDLVKNLNKRAKEACKNPKAKFVIKAQNCQ